jgi:heavy metal sensor kinase
MKIFKSIKWRLQLWYGLILALALTGLVGTSYQLEWARQFHNIDMDLNGRLETLVNLMQSPPPPPPEPDGPLPGGPPPGRPFPGRPPFGLHLPPSTISSFFDETGTNGFYYVIWSPEGKELMRSPNAPSGLTLPLHTTMQIRGVYCELVTPVPAMKPVYRILVGRSIAPELEELHRNTLHSIWGGAVLLLAGLVGGWGVAGRVLRPIENISATAVKIAAGDLSQRINVAETESELGKLAAVLNSTFTRLEAAFAQQQQFTADAAHELRTPVSVMLTQTQTALTRERTAAEYRETIEACQRSAQRMRRLIESLLELARLDAGQEPLKRMPFDLSQMVREGIESIRPLADERGVKILSELGSLEITGDSGRLAQVIANLLTNAIQYNPSGGEVRLKLESQPGLAVLTVADTGQGISNEDLPHVFERFYRGDKSRTASNGNAGLGLAISKAIVEAHGGTIEVASQTGTGTTFTVRLPAT